MNLRVNYVSIYLLAMLLLSLAGNVTLGWEVLDLRRKLSPKIESRVDFFVPSSLLVSSPGGIRHTITFLGDKPTVLYITDRKCSWCARNVDNIITLAEQRSKTFRFIGLTRGDPRSLNEPTNYALPFPVFGDLTPEDWERLSFLGTPQTLVVSERGHVIHNWIGSYQGQVGDAIEAYFKVTLPGLRKPAEDEGGDQK